MYDVDVHFIYVYMVPCCYLPAWSLNSPCEPGHRIRWTTTRPYNRRLLPPFVVPHVIIYLNSFILYHLTIVLSTQFHQTSLGDGISTTTKPRLHSGPGSVPHDRRSPRILTFKSDKEMDLIPVTL